MTKVEEKDRILVVDDAVDTLEVLNRNLSFHGYRVITAMSVLEAIDILSATQVDLVITDLKMPGISGLELVRHIRNNLKDTEVIMITGYPSVEGAVEAVKNGVQEYLPKPFTAEELISSVQHVLEKLHTRRMAQGQFHVLQYTNLDIIGVSKGMQKVCADVMKAASSLATVMITGESGTGKELVARAIHYASSRASAPFVPINCGSIPETLLESELFGYVKGAFTGANESRLGFFQTADGGTIFLDEIGETPASMQVKVLRVLQEKEVSMVGSCKTRKIDVRIVAATNKDLQTLVKKGIFREDLFYRLNVITIEIPPLRERESDIFLLINYFAKKYSKESGRPTVRFSDKALDVLKNYNWPGNVRELQNLIQRLVVMTEGETIDVPDLPSLFRFSPLFKHTYNRTLDEVEEEHIKNVLANVNGNKSKASQILGIDRKTLRQKLDKYRLEEKK